MEQRPHKSTTHEERFLHIKTPDSPKFEAVTVFMRKEDDGNWYSTPALCVKGDEFNRRIGRNISRRRYFQEPDIRANFGKEIDYERIIPTVKALATFC